MFIKYLLQNFSNVFGTWIFLTLLNQLVFFGSCLRPDCILASMPHVSAITLIVLYKIYSHEKTTYDVETGYNGLGFNKEGYDSSGYNEKGYDRDGFNLDGYDVYGKDRKGKGFFGRLFTGNDYAKEISKLNKEAINTNNRRAEGQETLTSIYAYNSSVTAEGGAVKVGVRLANAHSDAIGATDAINHLTTYKAELKVKLDAARAARIPSDAEPKKNNSLQKKQEDFSKKIEYTDSMFLDNYKKISDKDMGVKNFRLYYLDKPTNLIWYDGKIVFIPKEYFLLKNLVNIDINKKQKCSLFASEVNLIKELEKQEIQFILEPNLKELLKRINKSGIRLDDEVAVELTDDNDYSSITEPIYMGDGVWLNIDNLEI